MDANRFDDALRTLMTRDRRAILALLGGGSLALFGYQSPAIGKKRKKKKCKNGTTRCGKKCFSLQSDPANCGGCGQRCSAGSGCVNGVCQGQGSCQSPNTLCNGECVDTQSNDRFCGNCATACAPGQDCINGTCQGQGTCTPACASDRACFEGQCTCTSDGQCQRDRDPNGNWCVVNPPGNPQIGLCGCLPNQVVCAAGESCSNCCTNEACLLTFPGIEGLICPSVPAGAYWGKFCCVANDAPCSSNSQCCSNRCNVNQQKCECGPPGAPCTNDTGCCSGTCSTSPSTFRKCV